MDLRLTGGPATEDERSAVDAVLGPPEGAWDGGERRGLDAHVARGGHTARSRRHLLLPALHAVQARAGWISPGALSYLSERLTVPPAEAYGVASFYAMFSMSPRPSTVVHVCDDIACMTNGADGLCAEMEERFGPEGVPNDDAMWVRSPCLGTCEQRSAALVQRSGERPWTVGVSPASAHRVAQLLPGAVDTGAHEMHDPAPQTAPHRRDPNLRLLRRIGVVDPESLDDYRAHRGYEALRRAVELEPEGVVREVKDSKLLGRGGAAFPTGTKWEAVAKQTARPHYFVCNADESEPGTFKDRILMELDPFAVIESLTIAGFATGSEEGYVYVRGEYPTAAGRLEGAIALARTHGFLGDDVMGEGFRFDVEVRRGAGAYICGEETALFNSIEGKRGEPRNKPPFPVERGLFGKPTGINNVETLINVLDIVLEGGPAFAATGTPDSTGTRLFCLSGCVERPGLYEVEFGATLRDLVDLAGGVRGDRPLRAVLLGGAAGSFVTPDDLDLPMTFEATKAAGVTLGSGVVMAFDDTVDLGAILVRIARFFRDESCGQCVPCRVGTARQEELLRRLLAGRPFGSVEDELSTLNEIAQAMRDASICGLGQTAAAAIGSGLAKLPILSVNGGPR